MLAVVDRVVSVNRRIDRSVDWSLRVVRRTGHSEKVRSQSHTSGFCKLNAPLIG